MGGGGGERGGGGGAGEGGGGGGGGGGTIITPTCVCGGGKRNATVGGSGVQLVIVSHNSLAHFTCSTSSICLILGGASPCRLSRASLMGVLRRTWSRKLSRVTLRMDICVGTKMASRVGNIWVKNCVHVSASFSSNSVPEVYGSRGQC